MLEIFDQHKMDDKAGDINKRNKNIFEVINEEKRKSKHSSYSSGTSEVDCVIAETSISEAVVENISTETFVVLEPGSTVKLSVTQTKANANDIGKSLSDDGQKDAKLTMKNGGTTQIEKLATNNDTTKPNARQHDKNAIVTVVEDTKKSDKNDKNVRTSNDNKEKNAEISSPQPTVNNVNENSNDRENGPEAVKSKRDAEKQTDVSKQEEKMSESNVEKTEGEVPTTITDELLISPTKEPTPAPSDALLESKSTYSPEAVAVIAQKLTIALAKQMVEATSSLGREMISAANDTLTLFNGSTLELADVDYFVIYKADNPQPGDGICFIARMELGTNSITKVIPVSPTRAWVSYYGGGIKLIDTEKEAVINKIDIPGLETIATPDETFLFTTNIKNSIIEKLHTVGDGAFGSSPIIKLCKCRIACLSMTKSGKNIMICLEKRHSFLCIPGKSEIVVQLHELNGKRIKELKPKVDGKPTPTMKGFPIVMCENINGDICIASFNSSDHSCSVEVYDKHLERRFVYDGDKSLSPRFMCEDICTDSQGNILMLDNSLKCVHIINTDGALVKLIPTAKYQIENPKCINVDSEGRLWIGQGPPAQMIILEYIV